MAVVFNDEGTVNFHTVICQFVLLMPFQICYRTMWYLQNNYIRWRHYIIRASCHQPSYVAFIHTSRIC